jgi:hypothetical protein
MRPHHCFHILTTECFHSVTQSPPVKSREHIKEWFFLSWFSPRSIDRHPTSLSRLPVTLPSQSSRVNIAHITKRHKIAIMAGLFGNGGQGGQFPLEQWFYEMPPCTRWWTAATVATSVLVQCEAVSPMQLYYSLPAVYVRSQVHFSLSDVFRLSLG